MWKGISANSLPSLYITQYPCERKVYRQIQRCSDHANHLLAPQRIARAGTAVGTESNRRKPYAQQRVTIASTVRVYIMDIEVSGQFYSQKSQN